MYDDESQYTVKKVDLTRGGTIGEDDDPPKRRRNKTGEGKDVMPFYI